MEAGQRIESYDWPGGREPLLRFGAEGRPVAILALPLLEEANRTRAFGVAILRALAARGIGGVLPELPAQGESERPTAEASLADLRAAFAAAPGTHAVAIRSGALLLDERPSWTLSRQTAPELLREMARLKGGPLQGEKVEVAGNLLSRKMLAELASEEHLPGESRGPASGRSQLGPGLRRGRASRTVRLQSDPHPADLHLHAAPLWRRTEPDNNPALAQALADDIASWIATCEG